MKTKKLVKNALSRPELFSVGEIAFFEQWLQKKKEQKEKKRQLRRLELEKLYLS